MSHDEFPELGGGSVWAGSDFNLDENSTSTALSDANLSNFELGCSDWVGDGQLSQSHTSLPTLDSNDLSHSRPTSIVSADGVLHEMDIPAWLNAPESQPASESMQAFQGPPTAATALHTTSPALHDSSYIHGRGLPRRKSRYLLRRSGNQSTPPIFIPNSRALNPMERWRDSPPEDEPASISAILDALHSASSTQTGSANSGAGSSEGPDLNFRQYRPPPLSTTSGESSASSRASVQSNRSRSSSQEFSVRKGRKAKVRGRIATQRGQGQRKDSRKFCCTFCCDKFKTRYDWARHEKSLHLSLEVWQCAPHGTVVFRHLTGRNHCAFCNMLDPSPEHLAQHNADSCQTESGRRSFRRKDHLAQHLRLIHNINTLPILDDWKVAHTAFTSRCGFCDLRMDSWDQRVDHLAEHFRRGKTMDDWKGDHDFPPEISSMVVNSVPPYLISSESSSIIPFSATDTQVQDHFAQISARARWQNGEGSALSQDPMPAVPQECSQSISLRELSSFIEVLTLHLSHYAREQLAKGIIPTDDMFQEESRRVFYDSNDTWNQTVADNPEWLSTFRRLYCEENTAASESLAATDPAQPTV
ncbi:hypothetical protein BDW67DRAFT_154418 [Aspergillus spinulosporus]